MRADYWGLAGVSLSQSSSKSSPFTFCILSGKCLLKNGTFAIRA